MIPTVDRTGWIPYSLRTKKQRQMTDKFHERVGFFGQRGMNVGDVPEKAILHELEIRATGSLLPRIWQQTGSCLPPNALVRMSDGTEKRICEVLAGDWVISHTGTARKVIGTQCKRTTEQMREIKVSGFADRLRCTDNHVVPTWNGSDIVWKKACEVAIGDRMLVGVGSAKTEEMAVIDVLDHVNGVDLDAISTKKWRVGQHSDVSATHRRTSALVSAAVSRDLIGHGRVHVNGSKLDNSLPRKIGVDAEFARLVGLYLAEGSCDAHRVVWTLSADEPELADDISRLCAMCFGCTPSIKVNSSRPTVMHVKLSGIGYVQLFKSLCPGVASTKRVPGCFFSSSISVRESLVSGWLDGDGYAAIRSDASERVVGVTSSPGLARDMASLLFSIGVPTISAVRPPRGASKESYNVESMPAFAARRLPSCRKIGNIRGYGQKSTKKMTPYGMARTVVANEAVGVPEYDVWDIEVEHDHTFIANGFVVHNCVGAGGARAYTLAQVGDVVNRGDQEAIKIPFPYATYGVGREISGARGTGEGSFGGAQAEAIRTFGMVPFDFENGAIPRPTIKDGWATWKSAEEIKWSHPSAWPVKRSTLEPDAQKFLIQDVTQVGSVDELVQGLAQGFSGTMACMFGTKPRVEKDVLLGRWNDQWAHQQCVAGYWQHPSLGLLFIIDNQWNDVHGHCPTLYELGVTGSYWILESDMKKIIKSQDGEVYLHSNTKGFPLQTIDWGTMGI